MQKITATCLAAALTIGLAASAQATAIELINNGNFETGDLSGWTVEDHPASAGSYFIHDNGNTAPISGFDTATNPDGGNYIAMSDQGSESLTSLYQLFVVPTLTESLILSFDMFVNNWNGTGESSGGDLLTIIDPNGLVFDFEEEEDVIPNQHARVDIMRAGSSAFSTDPLDVIANFYIGADIVGDVNPFAEYSFDVTGLLTGGESYILRFAEVDTEFYFNHGIDNVSLLAEMDRTTEVPEPAALGLMGIGLAGLAFSRRRKKA